MREDESVKYYIKSSGAFETSSFENISAGTAEIFSKELVSNAPQFF